MSSADVTSGIRDTAPARLHTSSVHGNAFGFRRSQLANNALVIEGLRQRRLAGVAIADVQRNLHHSTPVLTMRIYAHLSEDHRIAEADKRMTFGLGTITTLCRGRESNP